MIEQKIQEYGLVNCLLLPFQPLDVLPYSMGAADVAVVTTDTKQTGLSVPSKTYSYLSVGAVLLCLADKRSELGRMMDEHHVGRCFSRDEIEGMSSFLTELVAHKEIADEYKRNSRKLSLAYTPENAQVYVDP